MVHSKSEGECGYTGKESNQQGDQGMSEQELEDLLNDVAGGFTDPRQAKDEILDHMETKND